MRGWTTLAAGVVVGVVAGGAVRLATIQAPEITHFHANWAVFIDGARLDLTADRFMEDVAACRTDPGSIGPRDRVHLHEGNADVVHVHHPAATWGALARNLGIGLGRDYIFPPSGARRFSGDGGTLKFFRNGLQLDDLSNEPVRSGDRVLISFGPGSAEDALAEEFPQVASDAEEFNARMDPATCMGGHEPEGFGARLRRAFLG